MKKSILTIFALSFIGILGGCSNGVIPNPTPTKGPVVKADGSTAIPGGVTLPPAAVSAGAAKTGH
jgi:hypothetical protein